MKKLLISLCILAGLGGAYTRHGYIQEERANRELTSKVISLKERVELVAYVPDEELWDGEEDDEADIIYVGDEDEGSNFEVEEFLEYDPNATNETRTKISSLHIPELQKVRDNIGLPIIIRSAARSVEHEKKVGGQEGRNMFTNVD